MTTFTSLGRRPDRLPHQPRMCDVLLLIMLPDEWQSFQKIFPEASAKTQKDHLLDGLTVSVREFEFEGYNVVAAALNPNAIESKNQGKVPAAVFTSCVLTKYAPQVIVNIGIACRINKSDCSLGDVVIATSLIDITGNTSIEQGEADKLHFRSGNPDIECNEELRKSLTRLPSTHEPLFVKWQQTCSSELIKIEATPSEHLVREGPVATGEFLSKSDLFHDVVKNSLRTTLAYEMEAYAIAETARLLHNKAPILILKGLSDDGDSLKNKLESTTKGRLRAVAAENAFRLLRLGLSVGVVAATVQRELPPGRLTPPDPNAPTEPKSRVFPYFGPGDFRNPKVLAKSLANGEGRLRAIKAIICESNPSLIAQLETSPTGEMLSRCLNVVIDSEFAERVSYVAADTFRLQKIWTDAHKEVSGGKEHPPQVVNRLFIEHEVAETHSTASCLVRKTPILTCLVENTGIHEALESFKMSFQRKHRVVIDFDAVPLDQLYAISNEELVNKVSSRYDVVFHYHLGVWRFFSLGVVPSLAANTLTKFSRFLIPEVAQECCAVTDERGRARKVVVPINANSMVLVINKALFNQFAADFNAWTRGDYDLEAPTKWSQFDAILRFFDTKKKKGYFGIVPQGKRLGDSLYFEWCNFAYGSGGGVFAKSHGWQRWSHKNVILDHQNTIDATNFYKGVYERCPPDVDPSQLDTTSHLERFLKGDVAMALVWTDILAKLFSADNAANFSAHVIPGEKSMLGGGVCCVHGQSRHREIAERFVEGLLAPDVQAKLVAEGWCSGYENVYNDKDVKGLPYSEAVVDSLKRGAYMIEAGPDAGAIREIVGASIERIVKDKSDTGAVLKSTATLLRRGIYQ